MFFSDSMSVLTRAVSTLEFHYSLLNSNCEIPVSMNLLLNKEILGPKIDKYNYFALNDTFKFEDELEGILR